MLFVIIFLLQAYILRVLEINYLDQYLVQRLLVSFIRILVFLLMLNRLENQKKKGNTELLRRHTQTIKLNKN